jgi:sialate O-acetylesterase
MLGFANPPFYPNPPMRSNDLSARRLVLALAPLAAIVAGLAAGCAAPGPAAPAAGAPRGELVLAPLFGDHAVLQRDRPVPVWGIAGAGDPIAVSFRGQTVRTVAGSDGRWKATLAPIAASADPADLVVTGPETVTLHDVVVGEVWLCSGQSNMEFTVDDGGRTYRVQNAKAELAAANYPLIRQLKVERTVKTAPSDTVKTDGWKAATPETVGRFTAVGYFFARDIHNATGVPVGIIDSPWGGTPVESWMSDAARKSTSLAETLDERWKKAMSEWPPERVAAYPAAMEAWNKAEADAMANHTRNPLPWPQPPATTDSPAMPGGLYNGMIAPLQPGAIRGILWYQGESNVGHAGEYAELFTTMIRYWRATFGQGDLPFYFVQVANFGDENERENRDWARLREAQAQALSLPNTGMAVTIDIGEAHNIHPRNKQEVGRRLALIARAKVYGVPPESSGPMFASATPEGAAVRVRFTHAGDELSAQGGQVQSLEVAGADKVFHPATAVIETDTLLVSSPDVPAPVAVRYAWTNAPEANLYGDSGLPAAPFRSDNW